MKKRQNKCPGCGLVNFQDAAQCGWCALALGGCARVELEEDRRDGRGSSAGLVLILFAAAVVGSGVVWHVARKYGPDLLRPAAAEAAEAEDETRPRKRATPPQLSGRSPSDPEPQGLEQLMQPNRAAMERSAELSRQWNQYGAGPTREDIRRIEQHRARQRELAEQLPPPTPAPEVPDDWQPR